MHATFFRDLAWLRGSGTPLRYNLDSVSGYRQNGFDIIGLHWVEWSTVCSQLIRALFYSKRLSEMFAYIFWGCASRKINKFQNSWYFKQYMAIARVCADWAVRYFYFDQNTGTRLAALEADLFTLISQSGCNGLCTSPPPPPWSCSWNQLVSCLLTLQGTNCGSNRPRFILIIGFFRFGFHSRGTLFVLLWGLILHHVLE